MDFQWKREQKELYDAIVHIARSKLSRTSTPLNESSSKFVSREQWLECGKMGVLGLSVPEKYEGMGLDALSTAYAMEGFGLGCDDMGLVFSAAAHLFACEMAIVEHASEEMKQEFLPKLSSGTYVGANAITEAESGSDVFAMKTTAVRENGFYVLNGAKSYVTNGPMADVILVYASTAPAHGHMGISAFLLRKDLPGLKIGEPFEKMGLATSPTGSVYFDQCRVPEKMRIGEEGQGGAIFKKSMLWERACLFAGYVGAMQRQLNQAIEHAINRRQFRKPIGSYQAISHKIADMKIRLDTARFLLYRACWSMDQGQDATMEIAIAKIVVSEAAVRSGIDLLQIHGGYGYMTESGIEQALRDAVPSTLFSGTSEIQRDLIAKGLGL
jgi:L-prolyl-PCP dehydrogenase